MDVREIPKKLIYKKIIYGKHRWARNEDGSIDEWAFEEGYCNGVVCEICFKRVCVMCNPNYDKLEDCQKEYYICPNCGERGLSRLSTYCDKCGQKLDWEGNGK